MKRKIQAIRRLRMCWECGQDFVVPAPNIGISLAPVCPSCRTLFEVELYADLALRRPERIGGS